MTYNPQGLKLELNASTKLVYVENIMDHHPDREKLITCHNFYPQAYTGLSLKHFNRCNDKMKSLGLKVAAFVSSNAPGAYGPWPLNEDSAPWKCTAAFLWISRCAICLPPAW